MKKTGIVIVWTAMGLILLVASLHAQYYAQGFKAGIGIGAITAMTDQETGTKDHRFGPMGRVFFRQSIVGSGFLQGELGMSFGLARGVDYKTQLVPFDVRLLLSPIRAENWNVFLYGGVGALAYESLKPYDPKRINKSRYTPVAPIGLGLQFKVTDLTALEISAGYNHTLSDKLELLEDGGSDDGFLNVLIGLTFRSEYLNRDSDGDGLDDKAEKELGTNPKASDSDGDGLGDGAEVNNYKTKPLVADSDQDGLTDGQEINTYLTSPLRADSDGDGFDDGREVNTTRTDPNKADTDGDGLSDRAELDRYKTNPLKADSDGDGLDDGNEINKYGSNANNVDSDGDGLSDGEEVARYSSNPINVDTDGDGLNDFEEATRYKTDPAKADTDGGTINDGTEVNRRTDPLDMADDLPKEEKIKGPVGVEITMEGITFDTGSARIRPSSGVVLDKVATTLLENPQVFVEIQGHTDNRGAYAGNVKLSQARAESVAKYLQNKGVAAERMTAKGMGPDHPVASNDTAEGREKNRRITFTRIR